MTTRHHRALEPIHRDVTSVYELLARIVAALDALEAGDVNLAATILYDLEIDVEAAQRDHDELAATCLASVVLLAVVDMAIFLEPRRSTFRTRLSHTYSHL